MSPAAGMPAPAATTAVAVIGVRDDGPYLEGCLRHLIDHGVGYAILDNGMDADARRLLRRPPYREHLAEVRALPFTGAFELERQIEAKERMFETLAAEWLIHLDVDEVMHAYAEAERFVDTLARLESAGFNAVTFDEFVFLPVDAPYAPGAAPQPICTYYLFQPIPGPRLMRARRKSAGLSMFPHGRRESAGGHLVFGDGLRLAPESCVLRHYMFRDQAHARRKYARRVFAAAELERGWHGNRIGHPPDAFTFPPEGKLRRLDHPASRAFDLSDPRRTHYWEWR